MNYSANQLASTERRDLSAPPILTLMELDPALVIEGRAVDQGFLAPDPGMFGAMRETCPSCGDVHLQLVLRQRQVKLAHLFCPQCTRCFDARYPDGSPALTLV